MIIIQFIVKKQRLKKICRYLAIGLFLVFSNQGLLNMYARHWQPTPRNIASDSVYSCAILLGGYCSPDMYTGEGYFNSSADRFIQAVKLYKLGKVRHIFISGGNGKTEVAQFREGEWTKAECKAMGIPDEAILYEDMSDNTAENALNTKKALERSNLAPPYLLITSAYHMPRASLLYQNAGIQIVPFPCNYYEGKESFMIRELIPSPRVLLQWAPYLKETMALAWYKLKGN